MNNSAETAKCCCHSEPAASEIKPLIKVKKTVRSVPSVLLSIVIAFFPKCPLCWAVYMSMFSCLGLAKMAYLSWLLPVLLVFLGIHLFMLYKKARRLAYYLPFLMSLVGALTILAARTFIPGDKWLLFLGMALIISGSLLNTFSGNRLQMATPQMN